MKQDEEKKPFQGSNYFHGAMIKGYQRVLINLLLGKTVSLRITSGTAESTGSKNTEQG